MRIFDLRHLQDNLPIETDLCIVGTGPAGISIASEFADQNIRVLLLESGGFDEHPDTQSLYDIESAPPRRIDQKEIRCRILGGSSHIWTGRCAPFDALDLEKRSWISNSGWPFSLDDLSIYLERAGNYLGLGPNCYDEKLWSLFKVPRPLPCINETLLEPKFWQFSRSPRSQKLPMDFGRDILDTQYDNTQILLHANVTHINTSNDGTVFDSVDVASLEGKKARIKSKALVLCCGGIENARLLLASNRQSAEGVGNQNGLVGRFLMDHTDAAVWSLEKDSAHKILSRFGVYWLDSEKGRHVFLHGLGLGRRVQEDEHLLNCHAYIDQFGSVCDDPWIALRGLLPALRSRNLPSAQQNLITILKNFKEIRQGLYRRIINHRPRLFRSQRYEFHCILEQEPDPENRITLSQEKRDALGMPVSKIAWKVSETERKTVKRMCQLVTDEFARLNLPSPEIPQWLDDQNGWATRCVEKAHPSGTTRMDIDPRNGVVDQNCQVHGVKGLFVSGSSVFPTSGAANPTLMIVTMSLRLSDWLKSSFFGSRTEKITTPALSLNYVKARQKSSSSEAIKVGIVGTGRRVREIYLPILQQLWSKYQIIGFTTGSAEGSLKFESDTGIAAFASAREMVGHEEPALLIVAVPDGLSEHVLTNLIDLGVPILSEPPLAWSASGVRKIVNQAAANKVLLGVSEQFPFLPTEQFKKKLIDLGVFGNIYAAFNDFHSYSYHGVAQLRRYLKGRPKLVYNSEFRLEHGIRWQSGSVLFSDGSVLQQNYVMQGSSLRPSVHFHGTAGAMADDEITQASGRAETVLMHREQSSAGNLKAVSALLPTIGEVRWLNPFSEFPFSDEQIAVATLLKGMSTAIQDGGPPPYTAEEFLTDMEVVQAFRYSANGNGRRVALPLNEKKQKILMLASLTYWRRKILR